MSLLYEDLLNLNESSLDPALLSLANWSETESKIHRGRGGCLSGHKIFIALGTKVNNKNLTLERSL